MLVVVLLLQMLVVVLLQMLVVVVIVQHQVQAHQHPLQVDRDSLMKMKQKSSNRN
jgi:hypothetical protein